MGKSPRSKTRPSFQPQARQPSRCTKCPNRPLRSQCMHTSAGKEWLKMNAVEELETPVVGHARCCRICPNKPARSECLHTSKGRAFLSAQAAQKRVDSICHSDLQEEPHMREPHTPSPRDNHNGVIPVAFLRPDTIALSLISPTTPESNIDPRLLALSQSEQPDAMVEENFFSQANLSLAGGTLFQVSRSPSPVESPATTSPEKDDEVTTASPSSFQSVASKRKPTQANPFHGHVDGVKRGNSHYSIYRTKALPGVVENSRDASRRFSRLVNKIVEKCEDLSRETSCWLFLGAQHTSARGGTISYASPRLRSEAQVAAGTLATNFNSAIATLLSARRADAVELQRKYEEAQALKQAAEAQISEQQRLINTYRMQYGELTTPEVSRSSSP